MGQGNAGMERRSFLATMTALGAPAVMFGGWTDGASGDVFTGDGGGRTNDVAPVRRLQPGFRNDLERVQSVVGASHGNFERVRSLVEEQPALAKASWDWGFGDWESALGAASHTGRREIALYLIAQGARPTLFSAAMLGQVDVVRAQLEADPSLYLLRGPHGIPLLNHARAGRDEAASVLDYLLDRFGADDRPFGFPGDDGVEARYGGRYRFFEDPPLDLVVGVRNDWLMVGAGEQPNSRVLQVADDTFHPTGAPAVRLRFGVVDGRAESVTVLDGPDEKVGRRVE